MNSVAKVMQIHALDGAIRDVFVLSHFWSYGLSVGTFGAIFSRFRCAARTVVEDSVLPCDS